MSTAKKLGLLSGLVSMLIGGAAFAQEQDPDVRVDVYVEPEPVEPETEPMTPPTEEPMTPRTEAPDVDVDVEQPDVDVDIEQPDVEVEEPAYQQPQARPQAQAQPPAPQPMPDERVYIETDDTGIDMDAPPVSGFGVGLTIGGGLAGFVDEDMTEFTDVGGAWEVRANFNTRGLLGFEAAYLGSAMNVDALGLDDDAVLIGTSLEGALRLNFLPQRNFTPYVLGGIGYTRYDVTNDDFNTSNVNDSDQMVSVPVAAGISYRYQNLLLDARGTYRAVFEDDLISAGDPAFPGDDIGADSWSATANVGFEF